ncbi:sugar phosphate isomerase/epimerase [Rubripirellula sp.]|nr:sugar phosphate isomerase/epimerase [Rubripirellula sp.]
MHRRAILKSGSALVSALSATKLGYLHALDQFSEDAVRVEAVKRYRSQIGIQLYTLRNEISSDLKGTIRAVADAGYQQVEPYGFPNADEMIAEAKACGLAVNSTHFAWDSVVDPTRKDVPSFDAILDSAAKHGLTHLVIPYLQGEVRETLDDYRQLCDRFNQAAEKASDAGIQLAYHNHAFEFEPKENGVCGFDIMMDRFSAAMKFEVDVFWVEVGGRRAADLVRSLAGRVSQLHLKDLNASVETPNFGSIPNEAFEEIGDGKIEMLPILEAALDAKVQHCHVEQDHSPHPVKSIQQSKVFLNGLG